MRFIDRGTSPFRLEVRRSRIHSRGVFAAERIPAHRRVIEYAGERISVKEAIKRGAKFGTRGKRKLIYLFFLRKNCIVDGSVRGNGAEIINHSCQPNLITRKSKRRIYYFSRRAIPAGDELTVDYRFSKNAAKVRCRCGSPNCRGTINLK